jgi:hypothetical protein
MTISGYNIKLYFSTIQNRGNQTRQIYVFLPREGKYFHNEEN